jgi:hypothetical protein
MLSGAATHWPLFVDPSISPSQNRFAYADSANATNSTDYARVGLDPGDGRLYRSYFNFPTTQGSLTWRGRQILSAEFDIELNHSYACDDTQDDVAWVYHTGSISSSPRMPWSGSGSRWLPGTGGVSARAHAHKTSDACGIQPDVLTRFSGQPMTDEVQAAANHKDTTFTIGLCACDSNGQLESSQFRWKKFYIDSRAKLIVTYDTVPGQPAKMTTADAACGSGIGTTSPTLSAQAVDADANDTLSAVFHWQQLPSGAVQTVTRTGVPANNLIPPVPLSLGAASDGHAYQWQVQTTDAAGFHSPWSTWCTFTVDIAVPPDPSVQAVGTPSYGPCDPANVNGCTSAGGPGISGSFTLSPNGATNVTSFTYGWADPPATTVTVAAGASRTITVTPPEYGLNTLFVSSSNGIKSSAIVPYRFLVNDNSQPPLGYWPLDTIPGHNFNDLINGNTLTNNGAVSWLPDARYIDLSAASFTGDPATSSATATVAGLDTSKSFSVAARVRLTDATTGNATAVAQDDATLSGFYLGSLVSGSPATAHWAFMMPDNPQGTGGMPSAQSTSVSNADLGKWVHLLGVFDAGQQTISLYVNGNLVATAPRTVPGWKATGALTVGRGRRNGGPADGWRGQIAEVRVWNRVVTANDLWGRDADPANGVLAPGVSGLLSPTQVGVWDFSDWPDCQCPGPSMDGSFFNRPMFLGTGWDASPPTVAFISDSHNGDGGLSTDGVSGYASTADPTIDPPNTVERPALRTDQSYTVAAWVNLANTTLTRNATAIAQTGGLASAFALQYNYTDATAPKWKFMVTATDTTSSPVYAASVSGVDAEWTQLVGVYDAGTGTVKLYVNGTLAAASTGASSFQANGSLTLGAARINGQSVDPFPGEIDEVQAWQGALTEREVENLFQDQGTDGPATESPAVSDGDFLRSNSTGAVYRVAGGAPLYVSSWSAVGGVQDTTTVDQSLIDSLPQTPRNGTLVSKESGPNPGVYEFAGGAPIWVSDWAHIGGSRPYVIIDGAAIDNAGAGGVWDHVRLAPADGTVVGGSTNGIYIFAGSAPIWVSDWAHIGGSRPYTLIDYSAIDNAGNGRWSHLRQQPADGTFIRAYTTGDVYRIEGGAPVWVSSWAAFGGSGTSPATDEDVALIDNAGSGGRYKLNYRPAEGTKLIATSTGAKYTVQGGHAVPYPGSDQFPATNVVDKFAIDHAGESVPLNHLLP